MTYAYIFIAVALLVVGHVLRMFRWKLLLTIYEKPNQAKLMLALAVGYTINFFIPFRLGDVVRAILSGRKLKNGVSFAFSTLILEHFTDIPIVCTIFLLLARIRTNTDVDFNPAIQYSILTVAILILCVVAIKFSGYFKAIAKSACSIFNDQIKYALLFFLWGLITAFKDVFISISKKKLLMYTSCMWMVYISSYYCLTQAIVSASVSVNFTQIFTLIFSQGGFSVTNSFIFLDLFGPINLIALIMVIYIVASLVLLLILSLFFRYRESKQNNGHTEVSAEKIQKLLPLINEQDRLRFFESYFSTGRSDNLKKFIINNRDIHILQDLTAGSSAVTMLCMDENSTFYRKYALGKYGDKLYEQVQWIHVHKNILPLPVILYEQYTDEYCIYDMEYNSAAIGLFNYIHSASSESSWEILKMAIGHIRETLHTINLRPAERNLVDRYIKEKIYGNLHKIEAAKELRPLLEYDTLVINGESYRNLSYLKKWLETSFLKRVFSDDMYSNIHGDFTVENLICVETNQTCPFYYIDPNTGNIHDTPALDYAKLLQSLHGGYEFLMRTDNVRVERNEIQFVALKSKRYADIYSNYRDYLQKHFSFEQIRSIYFHEVVHWLRLMPYKITNDSTRAVLFYAGLIRVFNDTVEWYGSD